MAYRILLVDDEPLNVLPLEYILRQHGYEVTCAFGGQEAWEIIGRTPPDLVITDWQMPELDGVELSARVRENAATAGIPIIIITTNDQGLPLDDLREKLEITAFLSKPFSPREVLSMARSVLAGVATA
jgi:CheY-like chemotaxis protein